MGISGVRWRPPAGLFRAANRVVLALLRSRLHRLVSGFLMVLSYEGAKTGRTYAIPVGYYQMGPDEVWACGARKGWIGNLREPRAVRLVLRGREVPAEGSAVEDREQVADGLEELVRRKGVKAAKDPFLGLPRNRPPTRQEALEAADRARIAQFRLSDGP